MRYTTKTAALLSVLTATTFLVSPAFAQSQTAATGPTQEIVVTGSRIQVSDVNSPVPISTISPQALADAGNAQTVSVFRNDPEFGSQTQGSENYLSGGGIQALDLRNLGTSRTLTLINGRRDSTFTDAIGNGGVDIGMIPQVLISRIDVERDGAGPTYGSDAVAGVVNFILDDSFRGAYANGYYGISDKGDGQAWHTEGKIGLSNDRGAIVVGVDYLEQDSINGKNRDWMINNTSAVGATVTRGLAFGPGGIVYNSTGKSIIACYAGNGSTTNLYNPAATVNGGCPFYDPNAAGLYAVTLGETERDIGMVGHYDITDSIQFKGQAFFADRYTYIPIGAYSLNTASTLGGIVGGFNVPATSSNNPYGQAVTFKWLSNSTSNQGATQQLTDSTNFWVNFGLNGTFAGAWNWSVDETISRDSGYQQYTNYPIASHIQNVFTPTLCAADPICSTVGAVANLQSFFENGGNLTPAQRNYAYYDEEVLSVYTVQQSTVDINGPLFSLPAGEVKAAVGAEYRRTAGYQVPDAVTQTLDAARTVVEPWSNGYSTAEGYGEIQAPLLTNAPLAKALDLDAQIRYTSFDAPGTVLSNSTTWKVGLNYTPVDDIRFRANYGTSFRAPSPSQLYTGGSLGLSSFTDPCNPGGVRATNTTINANCIAAGAPQGPNPPSSTVYTQSAGSPGLQPERGKAFTVGSVFTPVFAPDFTATLDYYNIKVTNAIGGTNLTQQVQACYASANFASVTTTVGNPCFGYQNRNPDQTLGHINIYQININSLSTEGLDFSAHYKLNNVGPGTLGFDLRTQYLIGFYDSTNSLGQERGTYQAGATGTSTWPIWRGNLTTTYTLDQYSVSWMMTYVDSMKDQSVLTGSIPTPNGLGYSGTPFYVLNDLIFRYTNKSGLVAEFGINNVLDKDPPYAAAAIGSHFYNTLPSTFDPIGRYFFVNIGYKF